jgi:hypothetical protein
MIINLCRPSFPVKRASVIPFHKILCLAQLFPDQGLEFIWHGEVLLQRMTFLFYQIAPESSIVVLSGDAARGQAAVAEWLAVTRDTDSLNERIADAVNSRARAEVARLRNLRALRIEKRGRAALAGVEIRDFNQPIVSLNCPALKSQVGCGATAAPSSQPLPNPWKVEAVAPGVGAKSPMYAAPLPESHRVFETWLLTRLHRKHIKNWGIV